jgi:lipoprotein-anchoring transpeptidase ErfK/SrfK
MREISRRLLVSGLAAAAAGTSLTVFRPIASAQPLRRLENPGVPLSDSRDLHEAQFYASIDSEPFPVPAIDLRRIGPAFLRSFVAYSSGEMPGTVIVDPHSHFLYFMLGDTSAIRYGVGVGKEGFGWSGTATSNSKQGYPPKEMIARQPALRAEVTDLQSGLGVPGGPRNPLGARAMYLWQGNKDTLFRIHGTVEPWSIGHNVSSGCIRMINQDAMDLYERVQVGTKVVVL